VRLALGLPHTLSQCRQEHPGHAGRLEGVCGARGAGPPPAPVAPPVRPAAGRRHAGRLCCSQARGRGQRGGGAPGGFRRGAGSNRVFRMREARPMKTGMAWVPEANRLGARASDAWPQRSLTPHRRAAGLCKAGSQGSREAAPQDALPGTAVSYLYVSEHHFVGRLALKTAMRDRIRANRLCGPRAVLFRPPCLRMHASATAYWPPVPPGAALGIAHAYSTINRW